MQVLRILVLCLSAALMLSSADLGAFSRALRTLEDYAQGEAQQLYLVKICGISVIAEFASDICRDAGEGALAHRIDVGVRIGVVATALPAAAEIMERIAELLT